MSAANKAIGCRQLSATRALAREVMDGDLRKPLKLDEFLYQVSFAYGLPERAIQSPAPKPVPRRGVRARKFLLLVTLLVVVAATVAARLSDGNRMVPVELVGVWRASAPQHSSWSFAIEHNHLVFETQAGSPPARFPITAARESRAGDTVHYEFDYSPSRGAVTTFKLDLLTAPRPTVVLPVPPGITWTRD
jgi:hypothetical protein